MLDKNLNDPKKSQRLKKDLVNEKIRKKRIFFIQREL